MGNDDLKKFQNLLRKLFEFDCADLDFGIYRILNYKRAVIEKFIEKDLIKTVSANLDSVALSEQSEVARQFREVAEQVRETIGDDALDGDGNLGAKHHDVKIGKKYLDLQAKARGAQSRPALEAAIFNHLYTFFNRYYDAGDFVSKRRYSRKEKYAVPYNGEEVYLHWANRDQYYIKTGEYFTDYRFQAPNGVAVQFKLQTAQVEQDNVKGDKRFFMPLAKQATFDAEAREVVIPFEYRPLTQQEDVRNQQDKIMGEALDAIPKRFAKETDALTALMAERLKTADGQPVSYLEHHLQQYARRNTSDFFIHKDLRGFLQHELDFYLKNEVMNLDELEGAGEARAEGWFQLMLAIRSIGEKIIAFLAQIEDFQKKLFEKRKFILETNYCVTVGNITEDLYSEIGANEAQWQEWKDLFHIDEEEKNLFSSAAKSKEGRRILFLKGHATLMLDTRNFDVAFVDRVLASFDDLDGTSDGLLVHGENFQALNLLRENYSEKVRCIYIDPPFNTGGSNFLYKNEYRHSSWMSMMANVVKLGAEYLASDGVNITAVDDCELFELGLLLDSIFGESGRLGVLVVENKPSGRTNDMFLATCHEYYLCHCLHPGNAWINFFPLSEKEKAKYADSDDVSDYKWRDFLRTGGYSTPEERPNSYYPVYLNKKSGALYLEERKGTVEILPIDSSGRQRVWRKTRPSFLEHLARGEIRAREVEPGRFKIEIIDRIKEGIRPKSVWVGAGYDASSHGTKLLNDILGEARQFDFPKSVHAVRDAVYCVTASDDGDVVLDFFAGSGTTGHATIALNREDGGNRKFVLVEVADYFDTVLLPRIKKVTYTPEWKQGKPKRLPVEEEVKRSPRIVKYHRLESYEDALNNIAFDDEAGQKALQFDDYLLEYMLDWETKDGQTFLKVEALVSPFDYKLRVTQDGLTVEKAVDLPETFNYLLGLNVDTRRVYQDKDRRYLVYRGTVDSRQVVVVWRKTAGWAKEDFERDKQFVAKQKIAEGADEVFVNSDSVIPGARSLDPVFKARMFASVAANGGS